MGELPPGLEPRLLAVADSTLQDELLCELGTAADPEAAAAVLARLVP